MTWSRRRAFSALLRKLFRALAGPPASSSSAAAGVPEDTPSSVDIYETLYEAHGKLFSEDDVVGAAHLFDLVGRIELGILLTEGLKPTDTLLDLGCGTGRLAIKVIPTLAAGHYIGTDISQSMLEKARTRLARAVPEASCRIDLIKQTGTTFPFDDQSVDMICAFSVFTHIEHEDTYRYLKEGLRIIRPGGRFVLSCLPMSLMVAREIFLRSAQEGFRERWAQVRNITTSIDLMEEIARLAGWDILRWYPGDELNVRLPDTGELAALGQSTCVLSARPKPVSPASAEGQQRESLARTVVLGSIELCWSNTSVPLVPSLTGPLPGAADRFRLVGLPGSTVGSLSAPPFAETSSDPETRTITISVSRLLDGIYRYSVEIPSAVTDTADLLLRAGVTVKVYGRDQANPILLVRPHGSARRWTVFEVVVSEGNVALREINRLEDAANEAAEDP